jgi:hypothetical protein
MSDFRIVALRGMASLVLVGAGLGVVFGFGGAPADKVYAMEPAQVYAALVEIKPPLFVFGSAPFGSTTLPMGDGSVVWTVIDDKQREVIRFRSTVERAAAGTKIHVEVLAPSGGNHDRTAKGMADHSEIAGLYRQAMSEQIDAKLNHREFDYSHVSLAVVGATLTNMPLISAQMDEAGKAAQQQDADHIAQAYQNEAQGHYGGAMSDSDRSSEAQPGEPMVDPDRQ